MAAKMKDRKMREDITEEQFWQLPQVKNLRAGLQEKTFCEKYERACRIVAAHLQRMDSEICTELGYHRIDCVKWRVKTPESCILKLKRKGKELTMENASARLNDIAGVRVVCEFLDDMYGICRQIAQDGIFRVIKQKDYVKQPKSSGYQSLHLVIGVPFENGEEVKAEIQFRTKAMDFWSDIEHRFVYKNRRKYEKEIEIELRKCAKAIYKIDKQMMHIRDHVAGFGPGGFEVAEFSVKSGRDRILESQN